MYCKIESINSNDEYFVQYFLMSDLNVMQIELFYNHVFKITKI